MAEGAEDRTEPASAKRLQTARAQGQVALSREVAPAAALGAGALVLALRGPEAARGLAQLMAHIMEQAASLRPEAAVRGLAAAAVHAALPFAAAVALAVSAGVLAQTGLLVRLGALRPSLVRLDPLRNLRRIAGPGALVELGRSLAKLAVVGGAVWLALPRMDGWLPAAVLLPPALLPDAIARLLLRLLLAGLAAQGALALLDAGRARFAHMSALRMSRQEVREELREADGDPHLKARLRKLRLSRARRRMLAAVPKAAVVVTNPTHYAVALAYERGAAGAPRVVAKGIDAMAARIREIAEEARVPLVANPPLARALWRIELDSEIPATLFQAVAEIIAYVWRLRQPAAVRR